MYLIISDLHFAYKEKDNRHSYFNECMQVKQELIRLIHKYKMMGCKVVLLFLGDIYDNSFRNVSRALIEFDTMTFITSLCDDAYSVIGNHELTYKKDNPFWTLVSNVKEDMENLPTTNLVIQGTSGVIKITDRLIDGEVVFNFNHYGTGILKPIPDKINIGLFHQDIVCVPAVNGAINRGLNPYETEAIHLEEHDVIQGYQYSYFGHFHKYYGKWIIDQGRVIHYLGSLGRPNVSEVKDNYLERTIPCVIVDDGKFIEVVDEKFNLMSEHLCVKFDVVEKEKKKREKIKDIKRTINQDILCSDVITTVKEKLSNEMFNNIIDCILNDTEDLFMKELENRR